MLTSTTLDHSISMNFKPERISKCASIELNGSIDKVFPLFGPIREKAWAEGWDPEILYSISGDLEEHMIFRTKAHSHSEEFYTWIIAQFSQEQHRIEYTVSTSNRIWFIRIDCSANGEKTIAKICYTYTSLTPEGSELNREALKRMYAHDLSDWQRAINYYLKNGKLLSGQ
jgi:hypothetical protein